MAKAKEGAPLP
jgi:hypothetical protein